LAKGHVFVIMRYEQSVNLKVLKIAPPEWFYGVLDCPWSCIQDMVKATCVVNLVGLSVVKLTEPQR